MNQHALCVLYCTANNESGGQTVGQSASGKAEVICSAQDGSCSKCIKEDKRFLSRTSKTLRGFRRILLCVCNINLLSKESGCLQKPVGQNKKDPYICTYIRMTGEVGLSPTT